MNSLQSLQLKQPVEVWRLWGLGKHHIDTALGCMLCFMLLLRLYLVHPKITEKRMVHREWHRVPGLIPCTVVHAMAGLGKNFIMERTPDQNGLANSLLPALSVRCRTLTRRPCASAQCNHTSAPFSGELGDLPSAASGRLEVFSYQNSKLCWQAKLTERSS